MNPPQPRAPTPPHDEERAETPSHRRGGNVETPGHPAEDAQDEEHLGSDEAGEGAQSEESESPRSTRPMSFQWAGPTVSKTSRTATTQAAISITKDRRPLWARRAADAP